MREMPDLTPAQALAMVPDPVRYTFVYEADAYADGVRVEYRSSQGRGFEMIKVKNLLEHQEYRGVNSQWRDSQTGQRFRSAVPYGDQFRGQATHSRRLRTATRSIEHH